MKKLLLAAAAATALLSAPALAADMPARAPVYKAAPAPLFNWSGFYVGGYVGGAWGHLKATELDSYYSAGAVTKLDPDGVFGGGTLGYNVQSGQIVYGLEVDLGDMGIGKSVIPTGAAGLGFPDARIGIESGFYGDVTGRIGYASGPLLVYGKGGWAFFDGHDKFFAGTGAAFTGASRTDTFNGWTLGGGIEYAFSPGWSVKAEYQHFDFGSQTFNVNNGISLSRFRERLDVDTVKVGLNYRFGGM